MLEIAKKTTAQAVRLYEKKATFMLSPGATEEVIFDFDYLVSSVDHGIYFVHEYLKLIAPPNPAYGSYVETIDPPLLQFKGNLDPTLAIWTNMVVSPDHKILRVGRLGPGPLLILLDDDNIILRGTLNDQMTPDPPYILPGYYRLRTTILNYSSTETMTVEMGCQIMEVIGR